MHRLRRLTALVISLLAICVLASPGADAANTTANFTVSTNVLGLGTLTTSNLSFGVYTSGQGAALPAQTDFTITGLNGTNNCTFTFTTASGIFQMTDAAGHNPLNYELCDNAGCGGGNKYTEGVAGKKFNVNSNSYTYTLYGRILANQTGTFGASVHQTVTATLTY
jgi:hypothetical protein